MNAKLLFDGRGGCRQIDAPTGMQLAHGECIAIIGASSGIGKELAGIFSYDLDADVQLILTGRTQERAERVAPDEKILLASQLDLEEHDGVRRFSRDVRRAVRRSCPSGRLGYLFLNAGAIYPPRYDESFISKDGHYDRLFSSNFLGFTELLKQLMPDVIHRETRVVFVSSVAHYGGIVKDVFEPNLEDKSDMVEGLKAYSTSKLAFTAMQEILAEDGRLPNSVVMVPGAVDTPISIPPKERGSGGKSPYPLWLKQFDFSARQGAEFVLQAAFVPPDEIKPGEIIQPYFFPFANSWHMKYLPSQNLKINLNTMAELFLQKVTHNHGKLWICPTSKEARSDSFKQQLKETYLS